jgi:segregation and condensation protein B
MTGEEQKIEIENQTQPNLESGLVEATATEETSTINELAAASEADDVEEGASAEVLEVEDRAGLLEALLIAHGEPLSLETLGAITKLSDADIKEALAKLRTRLEQGNAGVELVEVGARHQIRTKVIFAPFIRELKAGKPRRLSAAALETLAVIAYRQPVVRSDIEKIRGVDVTPTLKTLLERKLVRIVGHQETVGQPALYGTTDDFLKVFGLNSLSQLPTLRDLKELERDPGEPGEEETETSESQPIAEQSAQIQQ